MIFELGTVYMLPALWSLVCRYWWRISFMFDAHTEGLNLVGDVCFISMVTQVKLASKRFLAGSLGLAAGVMLYVSLVEIFVKSQSAFSNAGQTEADAYTYATLCLFGGIIFYKGLDQLVHLLDGSAGDHNVDINLFDLDSRSSGEQSPEGVVAMGSEAPKAAKKAPRNSQKKNHQFPHDHDVVVELGNSNLTIQPSPDLHSLHLSMAGRVQQANGSPVATLTPPNEEDLEASSEKILKEEPTGGEMEAENRPMEGERLVRMGVMTALAIGIHNFPEGLVTFVAALSDPSVGTALAVAIAIHNIPEGLCVAIPVYYATGNRWKAFGWALISGISEPIGAGLGWLILKNIMTETVYGILFGVVAGMMINICIHELIPTAVRYDPADKVTTNSIIVGMAVMALSLSLFLYG
ncbi:unnamed protein product [Choristocarpus tenellus]